jgi:GntR family transcriptional repressor for pyruvate dehydrogenase complex
VVEQDADRASAIAEQHFGLTERLIRDLVERIGNATATEADG